MSGKPPGDYTVGRGKPPRSHQFARGVSGNPGGRPRGSKGTKHRSAFDVLFERSVLVERNGVEREVTVEEALEQSILQQAFAGKRSAWRQVLKMIAAREAARGRLSPRPSGVRVRSEAPDPDNADAALRLLGIARSTEEEGHKRLQLEGWAVRAALDRRPRGLDQADLTAIRSSVLDPHKIVWPHEDR